ncbi:MAG: hypothetical protein R2762_26595 [Bryobacteraceae bacterium]
MNTATRLVNANAKLEEILLRREQTNNPLFGRDTEWHIVDRELRDLEREIMANPGALQALFAPPQTPVEDD